MPPIDLAILNATQLDVMRAKAALDKAEASLAAAQAKRRDAEAAVAVAARIGDRAAETKARQAAERAAAGVLSNRQAREGLFGDLRERLDSLIQLELYAPGDVPLLMMPLRLETRFGQNEAGRPVLRIRIYPDDINTDLTSLGLLPEEEAAARAYWSTLFAAADDSGIDAAWAQFRAKVNRNRLRLVARAMRPTNAALRGTGAAPEFPVMRAATKSASSARLLPDLFRVTAWQGGRQLRGQGKSVDPNLKIGLLADDGSQLVDQDGLKVLEGTEWLSDYGQALARGMAIELPLASAAPIETLYVYGICQRFTPEQGAVELAGLLTAHDEGPGLAFVAQGTPTNNTEESAAGWKRWQEPAPLGLASPALPEDANGAVLATALGLPADAASLFEAQGAGLREQGAAAAMNAALWPATWGYFAEALDQGQKALDPVMIEEGRVFHQAHVRGRGCLPALRVGDQPYGIFAFAGFGKRFKPLGAGSTETKMEALLRKAYPNWLNAVEDIPRLRPGDTTEAVLKIFRQSPVSWGVRARTCLSRDLIDKIQLVSDQPKAAGDVEALLTQLLAESLGGFSYMHGPGSLDTKTRPVLLPYGDAARDVAFVQALLSGGRTSDISSVFQALVSLGHAQLTAAATPPKNTSDAIRATASLNPALSERIIGTVTAATPSDGKLYRALLLDVQQSSSNAPPQMLAEGLVPLATAGTWADQTLNATSTLERGRVGILFVDRLLRAQMQLADMRAGLQSLVDIASATPGYDFSLLVAETLDTASHRLDAWVAGLSSARLKRMRSLRAQGVSIGAFGWLFDLVPQQRAAPSGGYVAAPSLALATTAGLLRSAYLAHNPTDGTGGAFAIELTSGRVRRAISLMEGVANGQALGALLGYDFERRLHEGNADRFILSFRGIAPLIALKLTEGNASTTDSEAQALGGVNVTDALRLLDIWKNPARGKGEIYAQLAKRPEGNAYLDPAVAWQGPSTGEKALIEAAMDKLASDADAVADLLMAESVHQLASGNLPRASATLDAAGKGEAPPPAEPDVVNSGGPGVIVTHRVIAVPPATGGWGSAGPRAYASPTLDAWAATRLPEPKMIVLGPSANGGLATLADTGLGALDFAALSRHPAMMERVLRTRAPLADPAAALVAPGADILANGAVALSEAMITGAALQQVLDGAQALGALNIGLPQSNGWAAAPGVVKDAMDRLAVAGGMLKARVAQLDSLLSGTSVAREALSAALVDLADFGIVVPELKDDQAANVALLAVADGVARLASADKAFAEPSQTPATVEAAAKALFGEGMPIPLTYLYTVPPTGEPVGERAVEAIPAGAIERYLADFGTVRPAIGRLQKLNLLSRINGKPPVLSVRQLVGLGDDPPDRWIGVGLPPERRSPMGAVVSILADAPDGLDLEKGVAGLLLDDWTETLARRAALGDGGPMSAQTTAGVAIHADAPGCEPPQSLILAMSPDGSAWSEDALCDFLTDTLDLAKARLVTAETLPLVGRVLPAIYAQSWSLQGTPVIDWSKFAVDQFTIASTAGLKNFTLVKEG